VGLSRSWPFALVALSASCIPWDKVAHRKPKSPSAFGAEKLPGRGVAPLADDAMRAQLTVGRLAMGGSAFSPRAAAYRTNDFSILSGASFRMVIDVGNWDQSVTINTRGQSGDPYSPHYRDLAPLWAGGEYVPLLYSRESVERSASEVFRLMPSQK
jgi:penicillin G amidase